MYRKSYQALSSNAKDKGNYFQWSSAMDCCLAKLLAEQVRKGNKTDNGLNPAAYMGVLAVINKKFGLDLTKEHLMNRLKTWEKQFGILKELLAQRGFKWDEKQRMVVADACVWKDYTMAHPDARQFQERPIDNYEELCIIIGNDQAIVGCLENVEETYMQSAASGDGLDAANSSDIHSDDNHVRNLRWTDAMDYYLGKSLVEKVKEGHKIDNALPWEAYDTVLSTLNEKIGFVLTKDHIRNRLKTWKKQYGTLRDLLSHPGFKWDRTWKMIIADDSVWTNYVKAWKKGKSIAFDDIDNKGVSSLVNASTLTQEENAKTLCIRLHVFLRKLLIAIQETFPAHPEARTFRGRVIENYDNLCTIFANDNDVAEAVDISPVQDSMKVKDQVKNMRWTYEMDQCLSKVLAEQAKLGNKSKSDNKLRPAAYAVAVSALNKRFQLDLTKDHIRNRLKTWKKQYEILKGLLHHGDFEWDKTQTMVIANDSAWNRYIKRNPDARSFRGRIIRNLKELCAIFGGENLSESSLNSSNDDVNFVANNEAADTEELFYNQSDAAKEKGRYILWTDEMDRCLMEQLVEQVNLGNKLQKSFKQVALKAAVSVISKKFSLDLTTENIRNRLRTWKKQYRLVKELLSQHGFKWDERQKMVIANDSEWRLCIKRNPEMSRIRGRAIDNFNELHVIVGNEQADRHLSKAGGRVVNNIQNGKEAVEVPVQVMVDEDMCDNNTDDDIQVSSQRTISRSSPSRSEEALKRRRSSDIMLDVMGAMAENIGRIADALTESKGVGLDELFQMVQSIPEFDDDLIVDACEYLSFDEKRARMFMKLDERLRKKWLLKRLRG
ncbi:hypothetical protein Goklo_010374 [Gossypium klotzschianum]|uniref:Myb/SANT-like domain-containing protein n=1 Tax=Gossypium klotzschianum TaxID=34286 RepID=A0A7J8V5W6_9ROSI|nr:hypothetical protein [Gossypium klotzschianum]